MKSIVIMVVGLLSVTISIKPLAQGFTAYSFGFIGNLGNINPQFSGTVDIQGAECFILASGIKTLLDMGKGEYVNNCEVNMAVDDLLKITASPNPIAYYTNLKLSRRQYFLNDEKVQLQLFNQKGYLVQQVTIKLSQLNDGFDLQLNKVLNNGIYFLKATNANRFFKTLTLLKQD